MRGLFWDLETTSLDTKKARIIQMAASLYDLKEKRELDHFSVLVWDDTYPAIERVTTELTGIDQAQLEEFAVEPWFAFDLLLKLGQTAEYWIAHNGHSYDRKVLKEEFDRYGYEVSSATRHVDTRFDIVYPSRITTRKLSYLAAEHGFANFKAHGARHDVDCMARLFFMYPTDAILEKTTTPLIWVRAEVTFEKKDEAKARNYFWEPVKKFWLKVIRESDLGLEQQNSLGAFRVINLGADFEPPVTT